MTNICCQLVEKILGELFVHLLSTSMKCKNALFEMSFNGFRHYWFQIDICFVKKKNVLSFSLVQTLVICIEAIYYSY